MKLISSGIPGLDEVLGGGFPASSIITISGPTGCGKTTFGMQFILSSKEPGIYIAIEDSKRDLINQFGSMGWDLEDAEKEGELIILDYPVNEVDQLVSRRGSLQEIINTTGAKKVVIDSIMPVALYYKDEEERKKGFLELVDNIRRWGVTTLIIANASSYRELPKSDYEIERYTHGWINLYYEYDEKTDSRVRKLEVLKMKGANHSTKRYPFILDSNGIRLLSTPANLSKVREIVKKIAQREKEGKKEGGEGKKEKKKTLKFKLKRGVPKRREEG